MGGRSVLAARLKEIRRGDLIQTTATGLPYSAIVFSMDSNRALRAWDSDLGWSNKDLRNVVQSYGVRAGWPFQHIESYVGHLLEGRMARHYVADMPKTLKAKRAGAREALEEDLSIYRASVVEPLDRVISAVAQGKSEFDQICNNLQAGRPPPPA